MEGPLLLRVVNSMVPTVAHVKSCKKHPDIFQNLLRFEHNATWIGAFWIFRSLGCAIRVMARMPSLNGVSDEWEADANARENMRRFNTILRWDDFESKKVSAA